ncbi:MAG TPA: lipid-binding SYLF domain-containing protein [Steroidobacteraceae bacterium]|jgi:lipid-binding SYLF domain-containing protein|nr:lipid-binding SYLF domain-containing protein [Steroidobacteraceae bacterium]
MHQHKTLLAATALLGAAMALPTAPARAASHASTAQDRVDAAVQVVDRMKQNPELARLLEHAQGVFIIPRYGKGAFIVGGQGGDGVVLAKHDGNWTDPAFFNIAGGSIGLQAGGSGGAVAMILMTRNAIHRFEDTDTSWTLSGKAGLSIVPFSDRGRTNSRNGDVIVWSDARGLYGGLTAGATHISPETKLDRAYYQGQANPRDILLGSVTNHGADSLRDALATRVAQK